MGAGANRLMMSTTIGSRFAAVFATAAANPGGILDKDRRNGAWRASVAVECSETDPTGAAVARSPQRLVVYFRVHDQAPPGPD